MGRDANAGDSGMKKRIAAGQFCPMTDRAWRRVSREGKDLIRKMLVVDPTERLGAAEARYMI